jgi:hypothetical protein
MNDVEKVGSSPTSSKPRTPAYTIFDSNTDKLLHLLTFVGGGVKGMSKNITDVLRKDVDRLEEGITQIECKVDDTNVKVSNLVESFFSQCQVQEQVVALTSSVMTIIDWMPVMIVTTVEAYLIDVLAYAASIDPTLMQRSEQSASYAELTTASSLEADFSVL